MSFYFNKLSFILILSLLFCYSCGTPYQPEEEPGEQDEEPIDPIDSVSADGILETVTWNLEWFLHPASNRGPSDLKLQRDNVATVMDSLQADFYALQEIYDRNALQELTKRLTNYRGFTAEYEVNDLFSQQTAFIFNTNTIDSVSSGLITEAQNYTDWSSGRYPFYFEFNYSYQDQGISIPIFAVVIHAKANTGDLEESYNRRKQAAESLYQHLQEKKPNAHIIFLGDFNDDLDVSIYDDKSSSPYKNFVEDEQSFFPVTKSITEADQSSYIAGDYSDLIDHIIVSDEMEPYYIMSSEEIYFDPLDFIESYEQTTSDHLPVWAKFDVTKSGSVAKQISP